MSNDGSTSAANSAQRTIIIEPDVEGRFDREKAADTLSDLLGTLITLGGKVEIVADRVRVGTLPPDGPGKLPEPLGETVGLLISYRTIPKLSDEPVTVRAMDIATGRGNRGGGEARRAGAGGAAGRCRG
jgi:hypothetical protein